MTGGRPVTPYDERLAVGRAHLSIGVEMQLAKSLVQSLDLAAAAGELTDVGLQRFPRLSIYACLGESTPELVAHAASTAQNGRAVVSEVLTMPRKRFGSRPVLVLSPVDLVLYNSLVSRLRSVLGEPSRSQENFSNLNQFGVPGEDDEAVSHHIVSTDIAAFYEYVSHWHLKAELSLRSADVDVVEGLLALLSSAYGEPRGLPQLLPASDRLADAYLGPMDRALMRTGWPLLRVADDFKIQVDDWATALSVIEEAAYAAREIGLVLSTEKTVVTKAETLRRRRSRDQKFILERFSSARDQLRTDRFLAKPYGEEEPTEPGADEGLDEALRQILLEWFAEPEEKTQNVNYLATALRLLRRADERIDDDVLREVVFRYPVYLEYACGYLQARTGEGAENWRALAQLVRMDRQSPWAALWLISAYGAIEKGTGGTDEEGVARWVRAQLAHRSETVRAEAAWRLAVTDSIQVSEVARLYGSATLLSRPSLAASAGRVAEASANSQELKAIENENSLTRVAAAWGKKDRESA